MKQVANTWNYICYKLRMVKKSLGDFWKCCLTVFFDFKPIEVRGVRVSSHWTNLRVWLVLASTDQDELKSLDQTLNIYQYILSIVSMINNGKHYRSRFIPVGMRHKPRITLSCKHSSVLKLPMKLNPAIASSRPRYASPNTWTASCAH